MTVEINIILLLAIFTGGYILGDHFTKKRYARRIALSEKYVEAVEKRINETKAQHEILRKEAQFLKQEFARMARENEDILTQVRSITDGYCKCRFRATKPEDPSLCLNCKLPVFNPISPILYETHS